ncbi:MAG: LysM peptidoglycan-binding domain-containing protein [Gammaproteobacteria bacterium]
MKPANKQFRGKALALAGLMLVFSLASAQQSADSVALNGDHPQRYIVQKGDTLWEIAGRFLRNPWQWKQIWRGNPRIKNPDLIYPGDIIELVWVEGKPQLQVSRDKDSLPVVKLSPKVISTPVSEAITTIPLTTLKNFFTLTRVTTKDEMEDAPYVLDPMAERVTLSMIGDRGYVRGLDNDRQRRFGIYRASDPYIDPMSGEILGYEALHLGDAVLEQFGDPSIIRMESVKTEIHLGDRLLEPDSKGEFWSFEPDPVGDGIEARIASVVGGVTQVSRFNVVVINKGAGDGLKPGSVMGVYRDQGFIRDRLHQEYLSDHVPLEDPDLIYAGRDVIEQLRDERKKTLKLPGQMSETVRLPNIQAGIVMVFRTYESLSYGLVMQSDRPLEVGDRLAKPLPGS